MAEVNRIDSIYDVPKLTAEQEAVEALIKASIEQIKRAREQSIDFQFNTKTFQDYQKKIKDLEKTMAGLQKASADATKASTLLAKQKEAEAKALLAQQKAAQNAAKETERLAKNSEKAKKAAQDSQSAYKQLALAFAAAAQKAKDLGAQYGTMDKRAQAAAKTANDLNNRLKAIDSSIGNHQRNVGNYGSALDGLGGKFKGLIAGALGFIGVAGVAGFLKDGIDEFVAMDKNVRLLQNTLNNIGVPAAFDRMAESAKGLAEQFGFIDDDDILKTFNQLIVYGKLSEQQINDLIPVIINFATATGQDLGSATSVIIKALEGNGKALKEYGIDIKDAKSTTEAFGIVMDELAPKVEGVGKAFGDSAAGGLASAQQQMKDLKEEVGGKLLPVFVGLLDIVNKLIQGFITFGQEGVKVVSDIVDLFGGDFGVLIGEGEGRLKRLAEQAAKVEQIAGKNIAKELLAAKSAGEAINELNFRVVNFTNLLNKAKANKSGVFDTKDVQRYEKAIRVANIALKQIFDLQSNQVQGKGADKLFTTPGAKKGTTKADNSEFERLKADLELAKEFDQKRLENEKSSLAERLLALQTYGEDSEALILLQAENELKAADLTNSQRLKIENDKNNALIRLAQELGEKLSKIAEKDFKANTKTAADSVTGLSKQIQNIQAQYAKETADFIKKHEDAMEKLKEDTKKAVQDLASELEGLFFDIFTNSIERQKNAIQDQIDLLEAQKQKDIEVANQTIANAQEKADAIAIIEARAAAKRQQLELRQRQLDQQKARFEKARAVAEIVQSTSIAVVNALTQVKTLGPGAIALAALIGAIGAVQIARVLAQPIPKYAKGTPEQGHPGGLAVVGDGGKAEGIQLPDGTVYKSPAKDTLVDLPRGTKVFPDYSNMTKAPVFTVETVDTTAELRRGFGSVVQAVKRIPQPIIHTERAWTVAHKTGSSFREYINRSI